MEELQYYTIVLNQNQIKNLCRYFYKDYNELKEEYEVSDMIQKLINNLRTDIIPSHSQRI